MVRNQQPRPPRTEQRGSIGAALGGSLRFAFFLFCYLAIAPHTQSSTAQQTASVSFSKTIYPILHANCAGCHSASLKLGGLTLDSYGGLMKGGKNGPAIIPGKSGSSRLVLMLEGRILPQMPMSGQLKPSEIAAIKAWIDSGARAPETESKPVASMPATIPAIEPRTALRHQVSSLSYSPDGHSLVAGGYRQVHIIDTGSGTTTNIAGPSDAVRATAYSPDGKWIAAGGGAPGSAGEVVILNAATRELTRTLKGHADYVYQVAFSPDGKMLATSSYDKSIKLWDAASGREIRTLKDHTDAVYPVAFSPDGKLLASGAADSTVKIWDVATGRRLFTLTGSLDAIYALAFHPSGKQLSAAGGDKSIWTWDLNSEGGTLARSTIAHEGEIVQLIYSPDGNTLATSSADRSIKIWDAGKATEIRVIDAQPDWVLALAFSPDGKRLAAGRYDGSITIYDAASGKRLSDPVH